MTPTRFRIYAIATALCLLGTALWSYGRLSDARDSAIGAASNLAECQDLANRIESLRGRPSVAGARELKQEELTSRIERAAAAAKFDDEAVERIEPNPSRRVGDGPYRESPTVVRLRRVSLKQLFTFLHGLTADGTGLYVRRVDLIAPREDEAGNRWNVETTLAQLVYAPKPASGGSEQRE